MFDHIIMNPPYNGSLHLKILSEAMKHSNDIVNLSPASQLFAPIRLLKKHSYILKNPELEEHIESVEIIDAAEASELFGASFASQLMLIHYDKSQLGKPAIDFNIIEPKYRKIFDKTVRAVYEGKHKTGKSLMDVIKENNSNGFDLTTPEVHGHHGFDLTTPEVHGNHGKSDFYEITSSNYERALNSNQRFGWHLSFTTEEERKNCYDSWHLKSHQFIHSLIKIDNFNIYHCLPWLGDYTHPWTDEMLYEYFDLTEDEITEINECLTT